MNILFIGDIVGKPGRKVVRYAIEHLLDDDVDFIIANLENVSHGKGLTRAHFLEMLEMGVDVGTLGNHYLAKKEINTFINDYDNLLRPYNLHSLHPGHGSDVYQCNDLKIRVSNLIGRVFMNDNANNPFDALNEICEKDDSDIHIVDFHAEATGEKLALAWAFDGKITALLGTHTHVQTNDIRLLQKGTLYISDVGMCGPYNGILGSSREQVIKRTWTGIPSVFGVQDDEEYVFSAVMFNVDEDTLEVIDYKNIYEVIKESEIVNG